jgi:hypothetical protein
VDEERIDAEKPEEALEVATKLKEIGTKWVTKARNAEDIEWIGLSSSQGVQGGPVWCRAGQVSEGSEIPGRSPCLAS